MRTFRIILLARIVSLGGSQLSAFGLGVWLYQATGSVWVYSLAALAALAPRVLLGPLVGTVVDRRDRRGVLIAAQAGAGACVLLLVLVFASGELSAWTALPLVALAACFDALEYPAFSAITAALVPPERLVQANGQTQLGLGLCQVGALGAAGVLLDAVGLGGLLLIDAASYGLATAVLVWATARVPRPAEALRAERQPFLRFATDGWRHIAGHAGQLALLVLLSIASFNLGMVQVLFGPLVLGFASAKVLGLVQSVGGAGFLAGGAALLVLRPPRRSVNVILGALLFQGAVMLLAAAQPSVALACAGAFSAAVTFPVIGALSEAIWQRRIPQDLQGRVSSTRAMAQQGSMLLAALAAGPLADRVFEPLMAHGGELAPSVGRVLGAGPGRGVALLMTLIGVATVATAALAFLHPHLRRIDERPASPGP